MKIHLVLGSSGQYEDYREWPVKAFMTFTSANRCQADYNARSKAIGEAITEYRHEHDNDSEDYWDAFVKFADEQRATHPDPRAHGDPDEPSYRVMEIDLV